MCQHTWTHGSSCDLDLFILGLFTPALSGRRFVLLYERVAPWHSACVIFIAVDVAAKVSFVSTTARIDSLPIPLYQIDSLPIPV